MFAAELIIKDSSSDILTLQYLEKGRMVSVQHDGKLQAFPNPCDLCQSFHHRSELTLGSVILMETDKIYQFLLDLES